MGHVHDFQDTRFLNIEFVVRVDVPQTNQNQDVKIIEEDFIEQQNLKL